MNQPHPAALPSLPRTHYDAVAMTLHWATVVLVLLQFATAELWGYFARPTRHLMIVTHMSFGILLALAVLLRIGWRLVPAHRVRGEARGWGEHLAKTVHVLLYAMLVAQAVLGFVLRWSGDESMSFFGLAIPSPIAPFSRPAHHQVGELHEWIGWTIIALAAGHALAALYHHFVLRDAVLWRMLPGRHAREQAARAPVPLSDGPRA
jgi:cytochrome b561